MTGTTGSEALEAELGEPPPTDLVDSVDPRDLARLAELVAAAKDHQVQELVAGGQAALTIVPRLLQAPFRRALGL